MSRMILSLVVAVVCLSSTLAVAGEPINRDGQWGLGASFGGNASGFRVRHWFSDGFGIDAGYGISYGFDGSDFENQHASAASIAFLPCFGPRGNVRLEGLGTLQYSRFRLDDETDFYPVQEDRYTAGVGLAVEYHFDEMPNLTFGASLIGVSMSYTERDGGSGKSYPKRISSTPGMGFDVTFYF